MSYDLLILAFIMLVFCFFMQILTVKVIFSVLNAKNGQIKDVKIVGKKLKKTEYEKKREEMARKEQEQFDTIMRNLEAYDGTEIGQEEVL